MPYEEASLAPKRPLKSTVEGTDADLRKLPLKDARYLLIEKFQVPESQVNELTRWEIIDRIRKLSTEALGSTPPENGVNKFARGTRRSVHETLQRYKISCQRVFQFRSVMGDTTG